MYAAIGMELDQNLALACFVLFLLTPRFTMDPYHEEPTQKRLFAPLVG